MYLLSSGVRYSVREVVKVFQGFLNGILIEVEAAQGVDDATVMHPPSTSLVGPRQV